MTGPESLDSCIGINCLKMENLYNYKIKWGDTLSSLAKQHHTTVDDILSYNPKVKQRDPTGNKIFADEIIKLPKIKPIVATAPKIPKIKPVAPTAPKLPKIPNAPKQPGAFFDYKIKPGDTLSAIGKKFNISIPKIQKVNVIPDINKIKANDVIKIPKASVKPNLSSFSVEPSKEELGKFVKPKVEDLTNISTAPKINNTTPSLIPKVPEPEAPKVPKVNTPTTNLPEVPKAPKAPPSQPKFFDVKEFVNTSFDKILTKVHTEFIDPLNNFSARHFLSKEDYNTYQKYNELIHTPAVVKEQTSQIELPKADIPTTDKLINISLEEQKTSVSTPAVFSSLATNVAEPVVSHKYSDDELEKMTKDNVPYPDKDTAAQEAYYHQKQEMGPIHRLTALGLLTPEEAKDPVKYLNVREITTTDSRSLDYYAKTYKTTKARLYALNPNLSLKTNVPKNTKLILPALWESKAQDDINQIIEEFKGNLNSPLLLEYVKKTKELQNELDQIQNANLGSFLNDLTVFMMNPENFHNEVEKSAVKDVRSLIGQKSELESLDTNLASQQLFFKKYAPEIQKLNETLPKYKLLTDSIKTELTPEIQDWLNQWNNFDKLSDEQKQKISSYYQNNKTTIDRVLNDIKTYQRLRVEIEAHKDLIAKIQKFQVENQKAQGIKIPFIDLIQSESFNKILSIYSRNATKSKMKIINLLLDAYKNIGWMNQHQNEIKIETSNLSNEKQDLLFKINTYQDETTRAINSFIYHKHAEIKAQLEYQKFVNLEATKMGVEKSHALSLLLRGTTGKFKGLNALKVYINLLRPSTWTKGNGKYNGMFLLSDMLQEVKTPIDVKGALSKYYRDNDSLLKKITLRPLQGVGELFKRLPMLLPKALFESNNLANAIGFNVIIPAVQSAVAEGLTALTWIGYEGYAGIEKLITKQNIKPYVSYAQTKDLLRATINLPLHDDVVLRNQFKIKSVEDEAFFLTNLANPYMYVPQLKWIPLIHSITPEQLKKFKAGKKVFKGQLWNLAARYQSDIEYYAPTYEPNETSAWKRAISPYTSYMKGEQFHKFKTVEDTDIKHLYGDQWANNLDDFIAMNPNVKDVMNIKAGTLITMRDIEGGDPFKMLPEEQRLAFKLNHPVQYMLYSNLIEQVFEYPVDAAMSWFVNLMKSSIGSAANKLMYKFGSLGEKTVFAQKVAQSIWFTDQIGRLLKGADVATSVEAVPKFISSPYILDVVVPTFDDLAKIRTFFTRSSIVKHLPYPVRKMYGKLSDAMRGEIDTAETERILDALQAVADSNGIGSKELKLMISEALTNQGQQPLEAVAQFYNAIGISSSQMWKLIGNDPNIVEREALKKFMKHLYEAKSKAPFVTDAFNRELKQESRSVQDSFIALTKSNPKTYKKIIDQINGTWHDPTVTKRAVELYDKFKTYNLKALKDYNSVKESINIGKNWEVKFIDETDPLKRSKLFPNHAKYLVEKSFGNDPTRRVILFNVLEYHDLPEMVDDIYRISTKSVIDQFGDITAYTLSTSRPYNDIDIANMVKNRNRTIKGVEATMNPNNLSPLALYSRPVSRQINLDTVISSDTSLMIKKALGDKIDDLHYILNRVITPEQISKNYTSSWLLKYYDRSIKPFGDLTGVPAFKLIENKKTYLNRYVQYQKFAQELISLKRFRIENPELYLEYQHYLQAKVPVHDFITHRSLSWEDLAKSTKSSVAHLKYLNPTIKNATKIGVNTKIIIPNLTPLEELDNYIFAHPQLKITELQSLLFSGHSLTPEESKRISELIQKLADHHLNAHFNNIKKIEIENYAKFNNLVINSDKLPIDLKRRLAQIKAGTHVYLDKVLSSDVFADIHAKYLLEPRAVDAHRFLKISYPLLRGEKIPFKESYQGITMAKFREQNLKMLNGLESDNVNDIIRFPLEAKNELSKIVKGNVYYPTLDESSTIPIHDINKIKAAISEGKRITFNAETPRGKSLLEWFKSKSEYQPGKNYWANSRTSFGLKSFYTPQDFWTKVKEIPGLYDSITLGGLISDDDAIKLLAASKRIPVKSSVKDLLGKYQTTDIYHDLETINARAFSKTKKGQKLLAEFASKHETFLPTHLEKWDVSNATELTKEITDFYMKKGKLGKVGLDFFKTEQGIDFIYQQNNKLELIKSILGIGDIKLKISGNKIIGLSPIRLGYIPNEYKSSAINFLEEMSAREAGGTFLVKPKNSEFLNALQSSFGQKLSLGSDSADNLIQLLGTMRNWTEPKDYLSQLRLTQQLNDQIKSLQGEYQTLSSRFAMTQEWGVGKIPPSGSTKLSKYLDDAAKKGFIKPINATKRTLLDKQKAALIVLNSKGKLSRDTKILLNIIKSQRPDELKTSIKLLWSKINNLKADFTDAIDKLSSIDYTFDGIITRKANSIEPERILFNQYRSQDKLLDSDFVKEIEERKANILDALANPKVPKAGKAALKDELKRLKKFEPNALTYQIAADNHLLPNDKELTQLLQSVVPSSYKKKLEKLKTLLGDRTEVVKAYNSIGLYNPKVQGSIQIEQGNSVSTLNKMFPDAKAELPRIQTAVFNPITKSKKSALSNLAEKLNIWRKTGVRTIIDDTGLLPDLLKDTDLGMNIKIITKDILPSIAGPGETMSITQKNIMMDMRKLYFKDRKLAVIAFDKKRASAIQSMILDSRSPLEKQFIHSLNLEKKQLESISRGQVFTNEPGFVFPRSPTTKYMPWNESLRKTLNETYTNNAIRELTYDIKKAPWAQRIITYKNPFKNGRVLLIGGNSPLLTTSLRTSLDDALSEGCTFYTFKQITPAESSMIDYLKAQARKKGIRMPKIQTIVKDNKIVNSLLGMQDMSLPTFALSSTYNPRFLPKTRQEIYNALESRNRIFVGLDQLNQKYKKQLLRFAKKFSSDPTKFLPQNYVNLVAFDNDPIKWLSNWMGVLKKEELKNTWADFKANIISEVHNEILDDLKTSLNVTKLDKTSQAMLDAELESIKSNIDGLDSLLGIGSKSGAWGTFKDKLNLRSTIAQKLQMQSKRSAGISEVYGVPLNLETWSPTKLSLGKFIAKEGFKTLGSVETIWRSFRSAWIHSIMIFRIAWHVRNAIDDGLRQAYGAKDTKLFFEILNGYADITRRFAGRLSSDFLNIVGEGLGSFYWGKPVSKFWRKIFGDNAVPEYLSKGAKYAPLEIEDIYSPREINNWSSHYGNAIKWQMPKSKILKSPSGEFITPEDAMFASRSGFYSQYSDPLVSRSYLQRISEGNIFQRLRKRFTLFDIDTAYYADLAEQTRRLMMYHDLVWDKGVNMAKAEALVKYWSFDYSDVDRASQLARRLFPFFTFNRKNAEVWLKAAALDPRVFRAATTLLRTWSVAQQHLPSTYQGTVPIGNNVYLKLPFGFVDILSFFQDPFRSLQEMMDNPARMPFGLTWSPEISVALQLALKKTYFSTTEQLKTKYGFTNYEAQEYLRRKHEKDIDLSTGPDAWMKLALDTLPFGTFVHSLFTIDTSFAFRENTILDSKIMHEFFKACGLNLKHFTDIDAVLNTFFSLRPADRKIWIDRMKRSEPHLYSVLMDYFAILQISKVMKAPDNKKQEAFKELKKQTVIGTFNTLEDMNPGQGYIWLGRMSKEHPEYKTIILDWFKSVKVTPSRLFGRAIGKEIELKNDIDELLKPIPSNMTTKKEGAFRVLGIQSDYSGDFTKEQLRHDLLNPDGTVKYPSVAEINIVLGDKWTQHGVSKIDKEIIQKAKDQATQWRYKSTYAKQIEDKKYAYHLSLAFQAFPNDLDSLPNKEQTKIWERFNTNFKRYLTPKEQQRYLMNLPSEQRLYNNFIKKYIKIWKALRSKIARAKIDKNYHYKTFQKDFHSEPLWFQNLYFYNHPDKKVWYDFQYKSETWQNEIDAKEQATFKYDIEDRKKYNKWFWSHEDLLKQHDKDHPGYYKQMLGWKHLREITEDDPYKYYSAFFAQPKDWIENVFKNDPDKAISYPFMYKWTQLMNIDAKNQKNGKHTHLAEEWFWLDKNKKAREIYSKNHLPVAKGKSILDYHKIWHDFWIKLGPIKKGNEEVYFNNYIKDFYLLPDWFKNYYLNREENVNKKIYYPFRLVLSGLSKEQFITEFWKAKWKAARLAWDKDDPGFLSYMKFWRRLSTFAKIKNWKAYFAYYYAPENTAVRQRYAKKNAEGAAYMNLLFKYMNLPTKTWEDRKAKRAFITAHPDLEKHWDKDISAEDAKMRNLAEKYYNIRDSISNNGSGTAYYLAYRRSMVLSKVFLQNNPDLALWFTKQSDEYQNQNAELQTYLNEYEQLTYPKERYKYVEDHPVLADYFYYSNPPGIRKVLDMQKEYFSLPKNRRADYLNTHKDLLEWWEVSKLPSSYWSDPTKFNKINSYITKISNYYTAFRSGDYGKAEILLKNLPAYYKFQIDSEEAKWFRLKVYAEAMETWSKISGWIPSIYFFRQLPRWIRDQYFTHHPESKLISYVSLSRFLEEPMIKDYKHYKNYIKGSRFVYKYKAYRDMPYQIQNEYRRLMIAKGAWPDRRAWTKGDWNKFWQDKTIRKNNIRAEDLARLPLLRHELKRAIETFVLRTNPRPFRKAVQGKVLPFF